MATLAAVVLAASATACSDGSADRGSAGANPTLATDPPTTTTTNPYAVPAIIDVAYVNRVLAGLDAQLGDVTRALVRTKTFSSEAFDRLKAIYADNQGLQLKLDAFQADLRQGFADYKPTPGNKSTNVTKMIAASKTCIFSEVSRDYTAVTSNNAVVRPQWVALRPLDPSRDPRKYNTTSWAFAYDGVQPDHTQPPNPCAS